LERGRSYVRNGLVIDLQAHMVTAPQGSQERTHFCSPELTQRVRMCLWSFGQISRYLTCPKATIPLFDCGNHSSPRPGFRETWPQSAVNDGHKATAPWRGAQRH
jgi:hypothetical protein